LSKRFCFRQNSSDCSRKDSNGSPPVENNDGRDENYGGKDEDYDGRNENHVCKVWDYLPAVLEYCLRDQLCRPLPANHIFHNCDYCMREGNHSPDVADSVRIHRSLSDPCRPPVEQPLKQEYFGAVPYSASFAGFHLMERR
jgi:hypothetical protein